MRKKEGFNIRKVCGENILVAEGMSNIDFSDIISMNETAAYLWNSIGYEEFTVQTLADLLVKEYEIDEATAFEDAKDTAGMWGKVNIIEGD
ncbi:MAG: PqqD family protein, partial [Prevotella sp.]|nr:PqqD family protein [Prevotella sp.]